jgi:predicted N-acetyltransferase YhbS
MTARRQDFAIRPATSDDVPAIRRVHESSIRGLGPAAYTAEEVESWVGVLTDDGYYWAMTEGGETFIVAETAEDGVIAFCSLAGDELKGLYVVPSWARRGVGAALLRLAEAAIAAAGHRTIRLGATLVGQPFYAAHGYVVMCCKPWKTRGGLEIDTVDMEKVL